VVSHETLDLSATQVSLVQECPRKWAYSYICGLRQPQTESQKLGQEVDDGQLQPYLKFGTPFNLETKAGRIANAGKHLLPNPALSLQKKLFAQHFFRIPSIRSKPGEHAPFAFLGYKDMFLPEGGMPSFPTSKNPCVADSKTTKSKRWAKTGEELKENVQAILYAWNALYYRREDKVRAVDLDWVYFMTVPKGTIINAEGEAVEIYDAFSRPVTVTADEVYEQMLKIDDVGHRILALWESAPKGESATDEEKLEFVKTLPPNTQMCGEYGGCPFRSQCGMDVFFDAMDKDDGKRRLDVMGTFDLFEDLEEKVQKQDAVLGINPPKTQAPPPAPVEPEPLSVAAPVAVAVPVVEEKPKRGRPKKDAAPTSAVEATVMGESPVEYLEFEVVWGREAVSPEAGAGYEVGPFSVKGRVPQGGDLVTAMYQAHQKLQSLATRAKADKKAGFGNG
jgi:hypothetical protein